MEERMKAIGGEFVLNGEDGTIVSFHIPIEDPV